MRKPVKRKATASAATPRVIRCRAAAVRTQCAQAARAMMASKNIIDARTRTSPADPKY